LSNGACCRTVGVYVGVYVEGRKASVSSPESAGRIAVLSEQAAAYVCAILDMLVRKVEWLRAAPKASALPD
jgi:hypothetical protein